jgi:hypothetical protein
MAQQAFDKNRPKMTYHVRAVDPPKLSEQQWQLAGLLGLLLATMAITQLLTFTSFVEDLQSIGLKAATFFGAAIIFIELWAVAACLKIRLSGLFRLFSAGWLVVSFGFWLVVAFQAFDPHDDKPLYMWGNVVWLNINWLTISMLLVLLLVSVYIARFIKGSLSTNTALFMADKQSIKSDKAPKRRK